jgi:hypothetical protein
MLFSRENSKWRHHAGSATRSYGSNAPFIRRSIIAAPPPPWLRPFRLRPPQKALAVRSCKARWPGSTAEAAGPAVAAAGIS